MQGNLILLRGLPGSGKTTLATLLSENDKYPFFSVDDFFTNRENGEYKFAFDKNHLAYKQCEQNTLAKMKEGAEKIFVHNTFTLEWEMQPYFEMASANNFRVFVVTMENRHKGASVHDISNEQLKKMAEKYKVVLMAE